MKHVHFMGIGGVGISALAYILYREGWRVSGCDVNPSALARHLAQLGVTVHTGHGAEHLKGVDLLVASNAIPPNHPERREAERLGIPVMARMQVLADILKRGRSIGVSGTHGKTTTTSMIAHIFTELGTDPVVLVGAAVPSLGGNARWGTGAHRIAEVDESDPLFAEVAVDLAVLTNLEDDHVAAGTARQTYHANYASLRNAARSYAGRAGRVLYNADWAELEDLTEGFERVGYGLERGSYRAENVLLEAGASRFVLTREGAPLAEVELALPGRHNVENAVAALAAAHLEGLDPNEAARALASYKGAARRFQTTGYLHGAWVVDDYAHHPTEVRATLEAARATGRRVRVVFQPHRYLRTLQMWARFAEALQTADEVWVLDVYAASEEPIDGVSGELIANRLRELGHEHSRFAGWDEVLSELAASAGPGDLILTMGAGDVWKLGQQLVEERA